MPTPDAPTLLYVEDDRLLSEVGIIAFEDAGFAVAFASTGAEAKSLIDERGLEFRALITDIDLGGSPDGWEVAKHAREHFPEIPIIYVTGGNAHEWPHLGVPGSSLVLKPYAVTQLVVAVSNATIGSAGNTETA